MVFVIASVVITGWLAAGGIDWIINGGLLNATASLDPSSWLAKTAAFITARTQLHGEISWFTYLGMAMSTGAATGIAINTAHELGHKPHAGVDDPAVVALGFKVADGGFRRVADVFTQQAVD